MSTPGLQEDSRYEPNRTTLGRLSERISADERESKSTGPLRADLITQRRGDRTAMLLSLAYDYPSWFARRILATITSATIGNNSLIERLDKSFEVQKNRKHTKYSS
ncbi:MAG: hypothetical protein QOH96_1837 [Blastocatellia bacterium]|jgi:hypothetical protein|nr:hypothetical protein [Blastocatellia bacterium]